MFGGLVAGHSLGYRLAITDPHTRAETLAHSGHAYFGYMPFALTVCLGVLMSGLYLQALSAYRGEPARPARSPLIVLLLPTAFLIQEFVERFLHTGHASWTIVLLPAFLIGLALQIPFALAALLLAWVLDSAAKAVGGALTPRARLTTLHAFVPAPVHVSAALRVAGLARGYGERAPPLLRRP
jgi:hypothetical protein